MKYIIGLMIFVITLFFGYVDSNVSFMKPLFSTKTPYFWDRSTSEVIPDNSFSTTTNNGQTCQITGLNLLLRHGARFPTLKWIQRISDLHRRLSVVTSVTSKFPFLSKWSNPFQEAKEGLLSSVGANEMKHLGRRFGKRFKVVLNGKTEEIKFAVTRQSRTKSSFEYFYEGLNATFPSSNKRPEAEEENNRLKFYEQCDKYTKEVDDNDDILTEYDAFENGNELSNVLQKVNAKFGVFNVSIDDILVIHQICAFELGLNQQSEWCQFFDIDDLEVIDYLNDIEDYLKLGYAFPVTWQQTCPFTSYMFNRFDEAIRQTNGGHPVDISFAHGDTILPLYTALGLFRDKQPFTAENYLANEKRTFRTSDIVPFSANIALALYNCGASGHVVKIFVNEEAVVIPACGKMVCNYMDIKQYYKQLVNCNFNAICENANGIASHLRAPTFAFLICLFSLIVRNYLD